MDTKKKLTELAEAVGQAISQIKLEEDEEKAAELEKQMQEPDFWSDQTKAAVTSSEHAALKKHIDSWRSLEKEVADNLELIETGDESLYKEVESAATKLQAEFDQKEFELKLSGTYDKDPAIISIYAGTGGTDAQDWAEMLERMYLRWAEKKGFATQILEQSKGEEAGIKSATFEINGPYAYGLLKSEKGVHRLVRLSPYNSDNLRQTSFALVEVMPQISGPELEIDPKDLKIDVFRSGGHGGQSVNTTDSAVRITHLPTKITVSIQNERSQLQNKEKAMEVMRARLAALMEEQHREKLSEIKVESGPEQWGSQIRSYVLHPYQMVKDHRTGQETSDTDGVLNGDIEEFIEAYLKNQIAK